MKSFQEFVNEAESRHVRLVRGVKAGRVKAKSRHVRQVGRVKAKSRHVRQVGRVKEESRLVRISRESKSWESKSWESKSGGQTRQDKPGE